jgi:N6-L-threonylcarbamoyladenine synthase
VIGQTRDDAAGEAFDKVARMLGLPYPGGPEISRLAEIKRSEKNYVNKVVLPRPMIYSKDFDFSFSGLKTAVLYYIRDNGTLDEETKSDIAKEFEDAVIEVLVTKTLKAMDKYKVRTLILGGGVSGNKHLQRTFKKHLKKVDSGISVHFPTKTLSTDNALMIAIAGYFQYKDKKFVKNNQKLKAIGNLSL